MTAFFRSARSLHPIFGVGDANLPYGRRQEVQQINARLADICRRHPAVYVVDYDALVARH